jgi:hypothetical protein
MKPLSKYILESFERFYKLSEADKAELLKLDVEYHILFEEFCQEQVHFMNVANSDEEIKRICDLYNKGKDFELNIKYEKSKFEDDEFCKKLCDKLNVLRNKFFTLNCLLSKYYIENIEEKIASIEFFNQYTKDNKTKSKYITKPSEKVYNEAIRILNEYKFDDVEKLSKEFRPSFSPEESQKRLQKIIDKHGFGWKVIIDDNMIPRMSVRPYKEFRISRTNKFSEVDLQSLEVHEIEVHTARKYYGLQTGLYLFLYGLNSNNTFDEGIAIYNSLHKTKKQKPNILFFTAIKIVMLYHLDDMSCREIFDFVKRLTGAPDDVIALSLIRINRVANDTLLFNSSANSDSVDRDYLTGYLMVKKMTEAERQDLIKYAIGPSQMFDLDNIKKFLAINKFKPLDYQK